MEIKRADLTPIGCLVLLLALALLWLDILATKLTGKSVIDWLVKI